MGRAMLSRNIRELNNQLDLVGGGYGAVRTRARRPAKLLAADLNFPEPEYHAFILTEIMKILARNWEVRA